MNIVMTGATAYIGKKLLKRLSEEGHRVYALVRESSDIDEIREDAEDIICCTPYLGLYDAMKEIQPEVYINLAGYYCGKHTPEKIQLLCDGNMLLPTYVSDAVIAAGGKYIIHTSSVQQCYGGAPFDPLNLYAATKQAFEDVLRYYTSIQAVCAVTLQLFDTYGADDTRNKVFNLVRRMREGEKLAMSPGEQKMYFCYVDDVVEAYMQTLGSIQQEDPGSYHKYAVRGSEPIRLKEFVQKYIQYTGRNIMPQWGEREYMVKEIMDPAGYGTSVPGWNPKISYEEGIRLCGDHDLAHSALP
ncbi:MAG: NAD(P)-dependent oxidoreductase [Lachnospiraceae bacterium]|nr:NAD(P)-dependent oxidoreductase [Lachnospiraceae bacterium]MCM1239665.1 NAD(P)-dependent oxidoreductase [Lachnospiraceae bacterium]